MKKIYIIANLFLILGGCTTFYEDPKHGTVSFTYTFPDKPLSKGYAK